MSETTEDFPKTVDEAVKRILSTMDDESKKTLFNTPEGELSVYHFTWGMGIRNAYGLWKGNLELLESCQKIDVEQRGKTDAEGSIQFTMHPDDASGVIMDAVWRQLQKEGLKTSAPA